MAETAAGTDWVVGVVLAIGSSILSCLGLILQKYAHNLNQGLPPERRYPVVAGIVCSPCWWASFAMMGVLPFPLDFFAYSFASQSLISPFAGLTLILNAFLAPCILGERLYRSDVLASLVIFAGTTMSTVSGNHNDEEYELDDLLDLFGELRFIVAVTVLTCLVALMAVSLRATDPLRVDSGEPEGDPEKPSLETPDSEAPVAAPASVTGVLRWVNVMARPLFYGFISAALGALQNVFFKGAGVLMKTAVFDGGPSAWGTPYPYLFLVATAILALGQLSVLNYGMSRYDAVLVFPLYNANFIFLSVTMGAIYYDEFKDFDARQWVLFPLGVAITVAGVCAFIFKSREGGESGGRTSAKPAAVVGMEPASEGQAAEGQAADGAGSEQPAAAKLGASASGQPSASE